MVYYYYYYNYEDYENEKKLSFKNNNIVSLVLLQSINSISHFNK